MRTSQEDADGCLECVCMGGEFKECQEQSSLWEQANYREVIFYELLAVRWTDTSSLTVLQHHK